MPIFGWGEKKKAIYHQQRIYHGRNRNGYCCEVQRIPASINPATYRPEYRRFSALVQTTAIPNFVVDSAWTPEEKRRVARWQALLTLPSTHLLVVWTEDPKRPRKILRAYLSLTGTALSPDAAARHIGRSLMAFVQRNEGSALLHPALEEATFLSVIASRYGDLIT